MVNGLGGKSWTVFFVALDLEQCSTIEATLKAVCMVNFSTAYESRASLIQLLLLAEAKSSATSALQNLNPL